VRGKRLKTFMFAALAAVALAACDRHASKEAAAASGPTAIAAASAPPPASAASSPDDWKRVFGSTHKADRRETDNDGITTFTACFGQVEKRCLPLMFAKHDAFRKRYFFTPVQSQFERIVGRPYLHTYVSLPQCGRPVVMLNPLYSSKHGWLFMNRFGVMVDGDLVLDRELQDTSIDRDNDVSGVRESGSVLATTEDLAALRKIAEGKSIVIRLTGKNSYASVDKKLASNVVKDVADVLATYDKLDSELPKLPQDSCSP
jgi:hypothetical protein